MVDAMADLPLTLIRDRPRATFTLELRALKLPSALDFVSLKRALKTQKDIADAEARLKPYLESDDPVFRAKALSVKARLRYRMQPSQTATVTAILKKTVVLHRQANLISDEYLDRFMGLYQRVFNEGRLGETDFWLKPLDELESLHPGGEAERDYYASIAGHDTGAVHIAIDLAVKAIRSLKNLGRPQAEDARFNLIELLMVLGRYDDAVREFSVISPEEFTAQPACGGMARLMNYGIFGSELARLRPSPELNPSALLKWANTAREILEQRCPTSAVAGRVYLAYGAAHLLSGNAGPGMQALAKTEPYLANSPTLRLPVLRLTALGLEITNKPKEALEHYQRLEMDARQLNVQEEVRQSLHGQARTLVDLGQTDDALKVLKRADEALDEQVSSLPVGSGRESFLANNESISALYVELLLNHRDSKAAYEAVVRGHRRALAAFMRVATLDSLSPGRRRVWLEKLTVYNRARREARLWWESQPQKWTLSVANRRKYEIVEAAYRRRRRAALNEALSVLGDHHTFGARPVAKPGESEAILAVHPLPDRRWVALLKISDGQVQAAVAGQAAAAMLEGPSVAALLEQLEIPDDIKHLLVLDSPALQTIDVGALIYRGQRLRDRFSVSMALDADGQPLHSTQQRALVVHSDPDQNLEFDDVEAQLAMQSLQKAGFEVVTIGGPKGRAATLVAVTTALADPTFRVVHFIGHASRRGIDGWQSGIHLHGGVRLTATDVLLLDAVPPYVILSACSVGDAGEGRIAAGLGVAQAFLIRGAAWVFGPSEVVDDRASLEVSRKLYADHYASKLMAASNAELRAPANVEGRFRTWQMVGGPITAGPPTDVVTSR